MDLIFCFDIDGTLLSTNGAGSRSFKRATHALLKKEPQWEKISMAGRLDPAIFKDIVTDIGESFSESLWTKFKTIYIQYFQEELLNIKKWIVFEGVRETLEILQSKKIPAILITGNIKSGAYLKLKAVNLEEYFNWENSIFGDDGRENREELAYIYKNRFDSSKTAVVVGDTPYDIKVGKIIGGISVAVATGLHSLSELENHTPQILLKSLKDFPLHRIPEFSK